MYNFIYNFIYNFCCCDFRVCAAGRSGGQHRPYHHVDQALWGKVICILVYMENELKALLP